MRKADYDHVLSDPIVVADRYFRVLGRFRPIHGPARLGLAISKRCARRAVDRNRIKRLTRESFRQRTVDLYGVDVVVFCRPAAAVCTTNAVLYASLSNQWKRLRDQLCAVC